MNCSNQACLFNIGSIEMVFEATKSSYEGVHIERYRGHCMSELHNVKPSKAPINDCPKFLERGLQSGNEFSPWFNVDIYPVNLMLNEEGEKYVSDLLKVRNIMHDKTI